MKIHCLRLPLPLRLDHINAYLINGPDGKALIDTGMATAGGCEALQTALAQHGVAPASLRQLFITHFHGDHCGNAAWLRSLGVEVIMPRRDRALLQRWLQHVEDDELTLAEYSRRGVPVEVLRRAGRAMTSMRRLMPSFQVDRVVDDGEPLLLAGVPFQVLITPGHSPGHGCLLHESSRTLICGDHVLLQITPNVSWQPGWAETPLADYRASLARLRGLRPEVSWPAHGEPIYDLDRRIDEILAHHNEREELLLDKLNAGPLTAFELTDQLFALTRLDSWDTWMALGETMAHVIALREAGKLRVITGADGVERYLPG